MIQLNTSVLILCGGRGTRLKNLYPEIPKPLIEFAKRPFVEWLTIMLVKQGFINFIYATGYLGTKFYDWRSKNPVPIANKKFINEKKVLGTGGAMISAIEQCKEYVLAINGDSIVFTNVLPMYSLLEKADLVIMGLYQLDCSRYGSLTFNSENYLTGFQEKKNSSEGYINGGIYLFRRSLLREFKKNEYLSFENDIIPAMLKSNLQVSVLLVKEADFIDIGVPSSIKIASDLIIKNTNWF